MKELIYTGIFVVLGILLIILLVALFVPDQPAETDAQQADGALLDEAPYPGDTEDTTVASRYIPGIYTTQLVLSDQTINVEVIVDKDTISSIRMAQLSDTIATMYPLIRPTFDDLAAQICESQSLEDIHYETQSRYTSLVLLEAIKTALAKAQP